MKKGSTNIYRIKKKKHKGQYKLNGNMMIKIYIYKKNTVIKMLWIFLHDIV